MQNLFKFLGKPNKAQAYQLSLKDKGSWTKRTSEDLNETLLNYKEIEIYLDFSIKILNGSLENTNGVIDQKRVSSIHNGEDILRHTANGSSHATETPTMLNDSSHFCWRNQLISKDPLISPRCLQRLTGNISGVSG